MHLRNMRFSIAKDDGKATSSNKDSTLDSPSPGVPSSKSAKSSILQKKVGHNTNEGALSVSGNENANLRRIARKSIAVPGSSLVRSTLQPKDVKDLNENPQPQASTSNSTPAYNTRSRNKIPLRTGLAKGAGSIKDSCTKDHRKPSSIKKACVSAPQTQPASQQQQQLGRNTVIDDVGTGHSQCLRGLPSSGGVAAARSSSAVTGRSSRQPHKSKNTDVCASSSGSNGVAEDPGNVSTGTQTSPQQQPQTNAGRTGGITTTAEDPIYPGLRGSSSAGAAAAGSSSPVTGIAGSSRQPRKSDNTDACASISHQHSTRSRKASNSEAGASTARDHSDVGRVLVTAGFPGLNDSVATAASTEETGDYFGEFSSSLSAKSCETAGLDSGLSGPLSALSSLTVPSRSDFRSPYLSASVPLNQLVCWVDPAKRYTPNRYAIKCECKKELCRYQFLKVLDYKVSQRKVLVEFKSRSSAKEALAALQSFLVLMFSQTVVAKLKIED